MILCGIDLIVELNLFNLKVLHCDLNIQFWNSKNFEQYMAKACG